MPPETPPLGTQVPVDSGPPRSGVMRRLRGNPTFWVATALVACVVALSAFPGLFAGWFGHGDPRACDIAAAGLGPQPGHPFGMDMQGCDVYANVIFGARPSVVVGVTVTLGASIIALVFGSVAGFFGRVIDAVISRITDVFFGFPFLLGALVILTAFPDRSVWTVSLALILFTWPTLTRLMRSSVLEVGRSDYVLAARALGASEWRQVRRHVIPNALTPLTVIASITVGTVIVSESALTYLGVGLQSPEVSWGLQLAAAQNDFQASPHLLMAPSAFLSLAVLGFILLGDAVRDALDPRS